MDPDKLQKLLQSLRKSQGYLMGLTWSQMADVFAALDPGWKLEKVVGIVKAWSHSDEADFWSTTREGAEAKHAELAKDAVTSLPSNPKANQLYVLDLGPIVEDRHFAFKCKPWRGVEGWRITSHTGKTLEIFPDSFRFGTLQGGYRPTSRGKIPIYEALKPLKEETDWVDQINKALNTETFIPSAQRTRDSTGSCPVCFQNIKLSNGRNIVLHGYKRPGWGEIKGQCPGTKFPAFELDVEGTEMYLERGIRVEIAKTKKLLNALARDAVDKFMSTSQGSPKEVNRESPNWDRELAVYTRKAELQRELLEKEEQVFIKLVQNWRVRPLPKEGERLINWYYGGQTDKSAFMVARRFSAAMDPAKMEALLLKVRKSEGKITTLTWAQLGDIFAVLDPGWKLEKSVGIVKLYGIHDGSEKPAVYVEDTEAQVTRRFNEIQKDAVTSLPSSPRAGQLYAKDLTPVVPSTYITGAFEFSCRPWMGAESWTITASNGKTFESIGHGYDYGELQHGYKKVPRTKLPTYKLLPILNKETDWLSQIDKKLGLGAFEKTAPRTRDATGSCPVCFQNIKLASDGEKMVLHGYLRPGTGATKGSCFGVGYPAFELNVKGTKEYLKEVIEPKYKVAKIKVEQLKSPGLMAVTYGHNPLNPKTYTRDDPKWKDHLMTAQEMAAHELMLIEIDFNAYTKLVSNWKTRPLPKEGDRHIDWFFKGRTD